jgi:predicted secreted hydrolase
MRSYRVLFSLAGLVLLACVLAWVLFPRQQMVSESRLVGSEQAPLQGFARASGPRTFEFPRDDGPHNDFQTEWWYFTGNLSAANGRIFGYQLTFFRRALEPEAERVTRESNWAASQIYLGHFTLSDVSAGQFHYFERLERGSAGLAGAVGETGFQVWLGDWKVNQTGERRFQLEAAQDGIQLKLDLDDLKGPILQGDQGYSQKGSDAGNASYYSSRTRLVSRGTVSVDGQVLSITGTSWMDHEFSTSALAPDQVGWDWFALRADGIYAAQS